MRFDILRHRWLSGFSVLVAGCAFVFVFAFIVPFFIEDNPSDATFIGMMLIGGIAWIVIFFTQLMPRIISRVPVMRWVTYVSVIIALMSIFVFFIFAKHLAEGFNGIG